jgi:hypothetical protein
MGEPDWRKSKLVFVISALETNRFDIEPNIDGFAGVPLSIKTTDWFVSQIWSVSSESEVLAL